MYVYFRSWRQPASASHRWLRSHRRHPSEWERPSAAQVLEDKWDAGSGFPAEPGKCVLGAVFRVLWAAPLCCNKEPAWIHTGTGNTNSTKFAAYVYISSFFPSFVVIFLINSHLTTRIKGVPACGEHHPGLTHTQAHASLFSHCILLSPSLSYLRALSLYLLIITEAYDRLASAVLEFIFILQSPFRPASCTRCAASEVLPFSALVKIPMNYSPFHNKCARLSFVKV